MTLEITYEQAMKAVGMTQQLHDKTGAFFDAQGLEPNTDSLATKELQRFQRPESLLTAYSQGIALIEVAADHLIAFTKTVTEPAQSIAPWTIARSVLEASALSYWLLDIKIDAQLRIQRSLAFRYEGLIQQAKFAQKSGLSAEAERCSRRIEEIEAMAESLGFTKLRNSKDKRTGIAQIMPTVTEIISDTLNEEPNYRLYSAMAHAHHWAYSQLSFRKAGETNFLERKTLLIEKYLPLESVWWLCGNVVRYFAQAIKCRCQLYGWDLEQLNSIINEAFDGIGIRNQDAS